MAKCATCGEEFEQKTNNHMYCLPTCRPSYNTIKLVEPHHLLCIVCGAPFDSPNKSSRFCGNFCNWSYNQKKNLSEYDNVDHCPMLIRCNRASGIDCSTRDFRLCDLFKNCVHSKRLRERTNHD